MASCTVNGGEIYTGSDAFTVRSHNADIHLKQVKMEPGSGVLVHGMVNPDKNATKTGGRQVYGIRVTMENMEAKGDLIHEDPDRDMVVTLKSTQLTGTVKNAYLRLSQWAPSRAVILRIRLSSVLRWIKMCLAALAAFFHSIAMKKQPSYSDRNARYPFVPAF